MVPRVLPFAKSLKLKLAMSTTCRKVRRQTITYLQKMVDNFFIECYMDFQLRPLNSSFNNASSHIPLSGT